MVFSGLGDKENAVYWLQKAEGVHVSDLIGIAQDSHFVEVRSDRRCQALVQQYSRWARPSESSVCFPRTDIPPILVLSRFEARPRCHSALLFAGCRHRCPSVAECLCVCPSQSA